MNILIIGIILCLLSATNFIFFRVKKGGAVAVLCKAIASFVFVSFGGILTIVNSSNTTVSVLLLLGLVAGLVGDIVLDLKVFYFADRKAYLYGGMIAFLVGHLFYISAIFVLMSMAGVMFNDVWLVVLILGVSSILLSLAIYFVSKNFLNFDYEDCSIITNIYSTILVFTTLLSLYLVAKIGVSYSLILFVGFVLFLASDVVLSMQYFGGKQNSKFLTVVNHALYYVAQILIATFIYFL